MTYEPCGVCTGRGTPGYLYTEAGTEMCPCKKEYEKLFYRKKRVKGMGIPEMYVSYNIETYTNKENPIYKQITKIVSNLNEFIETGSQLYFYGPACTQKTSVATYLVKTAILSGKSAMYTTMPRMVGTIIEAGDFETENSGRTLLEESSLLVIDNAFDLSKLYFSGKSNFKSTIIYDILQTRVANNRANVYIASCPISDIKYGIKSGKDDTAYFDPIIRGLLERNCLEMHFTDKINVKETRSNLLQSLIQEK